MAMKSSSVCALEPEKITKTKWIQWYGTPCRNDIKIKNIGSIGSIESIDSIDSIESIESIHCYNISKL